MKRQRRQYGLPLELGVLQSIEKLTFEQFAKKIEGYDAESGCNLAWVLYHMVEDEIYHRGQISILRKLYKNQHG